MAVFLLATAIINDRAGNEATGIEPDEDDSKGHELATDGGHCRR